MDFDFICINFELNIALDGGYKEHGLFIFAITEAPTKINQKKSAS